MKFEDIIENGRKVIKVTIEDADKIKFAGSVEAYDKQIEWEKTQWCECEGETGTKYYPDNKHPQCKKHHYRCTSCKKIKQIG